MTSLRTLLRQRWGDALVLALLVFALAEIALTPAWTQQDSGGTLADASAWVAVPFAFLWTLPLLFRRRSGLAAGLAVAFSAVVLALISNAATYSVALFIAFLAASAVIGLHEDLVHAVAGGIAVYVSGLVIDSTNPGAIPASDIFVFAIFSFAPLAGAQVVRLYSERAVALADRAARLEHLQQVQAELAVADERARIANELHDVIAQGVSVMTVQAGGARLLLRSDPAKARAAIEAVEQAGREALAETRRLLGILREDTTPERAPQPGLDDLANVVERARSAGVSMALHVEGQPRPVSASVSLTAYRIVSEACAFSESVGGVKRGDVMLRWLPDALEIEVAGDGSADSSSSSRLLARIAERIRVQGGTLEIGRRPDGAGVFTARIPLEV